jgi:hypothetical protein
LRAGCKKWLLRAKGGNRFTMKTRTVQGVLYVWLEESKHLAIVASPERKRPMIRAIGWVGNCTECHRPIVDGDSFYDGGTRETRAHCDCVVEARRAVRA